MAAGPPNRRSDDPRHSRHHCQGAAIDTDPALPVQTKYGADTFVVIEKWGSMDALKAHGAAPHMQAYGAKTRELIASHVIHGPLALLRRRRKRRPRTPVDAGFA